MRILYLKVMAPPGVDAPDRAGGLGFTSLISDVPQLLITALIVDLLQIYSTEFVQADLKENERASGVDIRDRKGQGNDVPQLLRNLQAKRAQAQRGSEVPMPSVSQDVLRTPTNGRQYVPANREGPVRRGPAC